MDLLNKILSNVIDAAGKLAGWFSLFLVILITIDVFCRYFLNLSFIWVIELEKYFFAFILLFGAAYTYKNDKHVRVDLFYSKLNPKSKSITNLLGDLLLLLPWSLLLVWVGFSYFKFSFQINESSPQAGGLPALYILKSFISLAFLLLAFQAILQIFSFFIGLKKNKD